MRLKVFRRISIDFKSTTEMRHGGKKKVFASNCQNMAIGFCVVNVWWCQHTKACGIRVTQKHIWLVCKYSFTSTDAHKMTDLYLNKVSEHKYLKYMVNLRWKLVMNSKTFFIWPWTNEPIHKNVKICDTI